MWFDPMYFVFLAPALLLAFFAQYKVQSAYKKYDQVANRSRLSGMDIAQRLVNEKQLYDVSLEPIGGKLSDHYDPRSKTLRLSDGVAHSASVAAMAIAAHEVGHAVQDDVSYAPFRLRRAIVPAVQIGSWVGPIVFIAGLLLSNTIAWIGLGLFAMVALFALITLPLELNASSRAMTMLTSSGLLVDAQETKGARAVLNAAALTYVAALAQTLMTLLYYVYLLSGTGRRRR